VDELEVDPHLLRQLARRQSRSWSKCPVAGDRSELAVPAGIDELVDVDVLLGQPGEQIAAMVGADRTRVQQPGLDPAVLIWVRHAGEGSTTCDS
jgi:hypothetical protein